MTGDFPTARSFNRKWFALLLVIVWLLSPVEAAQAIILYGGTPPDMNTSVTNGDTFILDNDSSSADVTLQFGSTLNETLKWNNTTAQFDLSDDLNVSGGLISTGLSSTGAVSFSTATSFLPPQGASDPATCSVGQLFYNTTSNTFRACTATNTWSAIGGGSQDFESIYTADADKILTTSNGAFTVASGTNDFIVDSNDWNVTAAGALDAASITSNGALTATGTTNLNGTANLNGVVALGDGGDDIAINSNDWDISSTGVVSGLTGISSSGTLNFSTSTSFRIAEAASDPATCTTGERYFNTTTSTDRICVATNTWTSSGAAGTQFVFAYDTTTQTVATAGTFQNVTFSNNGQLDGWTHTAGTAEFTAVAAGTYMANVTGRVAKNGGANSTLSMIGTINGTEITGSQGYGTISGSSGDTMSVNFIFTITSGQVFRIQMTAGTVNGQILPGGNATTQPSAQLSIWRLK